VFEIHAESRFNRNLIAKLVWKSDFDQPIVRFGHLCWKNGTKWLLWRYSGCWI